MKLTTAGKMRRTVKGGRKAQLKRAKIERIRDQRIEKFFGTKDYSRIVEIKRNSTMGGEVGIVTHNIDIVTQLKQELLFDKNGVVTPYGEAIQKKILRLSSLDTASEEYTSSIEVLSTKSSVNGRNSVNVDVANVNVDSLRKFGGQLLKTSVFKTLDSWNKFISDYDCVGRLFQETCIDGKRSAIKQSSIIKKSATLASKSILLAGNYNNFRDGVIYKDLKNLGQKFEFNYGEVVENYMKGGLNDGISYDYHLDTKIKAIDAVESVINGKFVDFINDSEEEKIVIGGEITKEYKDFISMLEEYSGIEKNRVFTLFDRSLFKITELITTVCDMPAIDDTIRLIVIESIASEVIDAIEKINSVSKKENGIEEDMVFIGGEDNIETGSIELSLRRLLVIAFMALETKFYARGGKEAVANFILGNKRKTQVGKKAVFDKTGVENNNPFFVTRTSKETSEKSYDYSLVRLHKVFSGFIALLFDEAELDLNDSSWKGLGVINGKLPSFNNNKKYKIAVLDAVRKEGGELVALNRVIEDADLSNYPKVDKLVDKIKTSYLESIEDNKYDVAGLIGKKLDRNPEIKVQIDKNNVPCADRYGLYIDGQKDQYVGTTGFYPVAGTVVAVFKNVLILQ